ncbi:MerR family transcriptional regulator [Streptomyces sp. NPDC050095]|uniref:MerR family transcriptional regulator n=1 Tax=unclassified Streptomyces TaxID=2593676 RepID=UPI003444582B
MQIGELSRRSGVSVRMLRYYETEGLLNPDRTPAGYRVYADTDVQAVGRIRMLSAAGLTLDVIQRLLPCVRSDAPDFDPCPVLRAGLRQQIETLDGKMAELAESRGMLADYLHALESPTPPDRGRGG